jgi:hypothetical protein
MSVCVRVRVCMCVRVCVCVRACVSSTSSILQSDHAYAVNTQQGFYLDKKLN